MDIDDREPWLNKAILQPFRQVMRIFAVATMARSLRYYVS